MSLPCRQFVIGLWLSLVLMIGGACAEATRQSDAPASVPSSAYVRTEEPLGPVIEFTSGDYVFSDVRVTPTSGWKTAKTPNIYRMVDVDWRLGDLHTLWGRFRFDRAALGSEPFAIYTVSTRNQFTIFVNDVEVFRNFASDTDDKLAWYRPFLAPIPLNALKPGLNEITIRAASREGLGVGRVLIGPHRTMEDYYLKQFFWRISGPMAANSAMLILGMLALVVWYIRRQDTELLYLAVATVFYFVRNYQYFAENRPIDLIWFDAISVASTYMATLTSLAFYLAYLRTPGRVRIVILCTLIALPLLFFHWKLRLSNNYIYFPSAMMGLCMIIAGIYDLRRSFQISRLFMFISIVALFGFGIYDFAKANTGYVWSGNDFYLALFGGFLSTLSFLIIFGARALVAFADLANSNQTLEKRVAETRADLMASEAARQKLTIDTAIATERGRLMQEMHDGIGSNLITALAVAEKQSQSQATIKTLRRAISDLKITVDSLEPVEGDVVALIGNLRHRMAADLREAGITSKWEVQPCGTLPWLDAANALHVLRIFQETISNAVAHAGATEIRIGCFEAEMDGVAGISTYVVDNGHGFDAASLDIPGKGLSNMRSRAGSLHGRLTIDSRTGAGTGLTLWLPYERNLAARHS